MDNGGGVPGVNAPLMGSKNVAGDKEIIKISHCIEDVKPVRKKRIA
jgi:hypothetical protein